jgi:hypothetical protein
MTRKRPRRRYERWRCLLCPVDGFGGLIGWIDHYGTTHDTTHVTEARTS